MLRILRILGVEEDEEDVPRIRRFRDLLNPFEGLNDDQVIQRYRFPPRIIFEIIDLLSEQLEKRTHRSRPIPPLLQVCITLQYLASNSFQLVSL